MTKSIDNLAGKITYFQKQILDLKAELKQTTDTHNSKLKTTYGEITEWIDLLDTLIDDLKTSAITITNTSSITETNPVQKLKSADRLRNRLTRFCKNNAIDKIPSNAPVDHQSEGVKIIETRSQPGLPDGTIIEVLREGYLWQDQILRKQEVITVKN